jgi:hypothetical protein
MLTVLLAVPSAANGQRPTSADREVRPFQLTSTSGYLEFQSRFRDDDQKSKVGAGNTSSTESILQEGLRLDLGGYVYHPNFLEFMVGGLFGLRQADYQQVFGDREQSSGDQGPVVEFDLHGDFFKKKPYPGTVFARRYQAIEPRPFIPSLLTTTTTYGVTWQYVSEKMPTNFRFSDTKVELDPVSSSTGEKPGFQHNSDLRFETGYKFTDQNALSFVYERQTVEEKPFDLSYDSDELTLGHRLDFGEQHQHRLESELNYFNQVGTFDVERARWRETLRLQHTDALRSWYRMEALDQKQGVFIGVPPIHEQSFLLSGSVEHQLYESLISQLTGYGQTQHYQQGLDITRMGAIGSLDYRKTNPWGVLQANYRPRVATEDHRGGAVGFEVFREEHTFHDPEPITLVNPNIEVGSIRITAQDRITVYQQGRDYSVRSFPDRVEIRRVPTGRIADGETVLIDYVFSSGGNFKLDTLGQDAGVRQNFTFGLSPYYRLRWQDQTISPATSTGAVPENIRSNLVGVEFERWSLRLGAEYEDYGSNVNPFEAVRLEGGYIRYFEQGATATVKARWTDVQYSIPEDRETKFFTLEGRYRHLLTAHLTVEGAARYRRTEDTLNGPDRGIDLDLSLLWRIRETELRVIYEFGKFEDNFASNDHSRLYIQVRRYF